MEQRFTLEGGGVLEAREEDGRVQLSCGRAADSSGLYKVWVRGRGGELLLGTLAPEGGRLCLRRTVTVSALTQAGAWPITGGRTAMVYSFSNSNGSNNRKKGDAAPWRWEHRPARCLRDPVLRESAQNWGPMLTRKDEDGFFLAAPLDPERPFPMTPIFCLGQPRRVEGRAHVVFSFDSQGNPRAPHA